MWSLSVEAEEYFHNVAHGSKKSEEIKLVRKEEKKKRPKPRLKPPTALQRIFGSKTAKDRYFTAGTGVNEENQRNVHAEASPFKYPQDLEEFSYKVMSRAWRNTRRSKEMKLKYNERQSYRTHQKTDLLRRLYVKEPEVKSMKTILDLDPDFFTMVEGRPVPQKFNKGEYIQDMRDILRTRIVTGYREDEIMLIEENFIVEQKLIDQIRAEFEKYVNTFEDFLFSDHTTSMALLRQADEEARVANDKYEAFRALSKNFGFLKSTVYGLEEKWRNCKMYQKFLYLMSPMEWRKQYDFYHIIKNTSEGSIQLEEESTASVFSRYKLAESGEVLSLENLIEQFLDDIKAQEEPQLYFTEPMQLLKVFGFIELQNLNTLLHSEELQVPLEHVRDGMERLQQQFKKDMSALEETIDSLEGGIIWEEQQATYLEQLAMELINSDFKEVVSNEQVINMYAFVEDVYENRIAPNDSNLSMADMMKIIEMQYRNYLLQLDRLPEELVYKAEMQCYTEEAKIMAIARDAARKVVQVERLTKHLARLLEPAAYKMHKDLKWRSPPLDKPKKPPIPPKPLTEEECDYLAYFVEYCEHTDDPKDFGIRVHKVDKKTGEDGKSVEMKEQL